MANIVAVTRTSIDWSTLLPCAMKACGRSISASLDSKGWPCDGPAALVACAAEMGCRGSDALAALRGSMLPLRHVHFGFIAWVDADLLWRLSSLGLAVTAAPEGGALLTASLADWKVAVREMLTLQADHRLRQLGCELLTWFERNDLGEVWGNYEKVTAGGGDQTYFLMEKV